MLLCIDTQHGEMAQWSPGTITPFDNGCYSKENHAITLHMFGLKKLIVFSSQAFCDADVRCC